MTAPACASGLRRLVRAIGDDLSLARRLLFPDYSLLVLFAIPGTTGFHSTALTIYLLAGMCVPNDDMDRPMEKDDDPLTHLNDFPGRETA